MTRISAWLLLVALVPVTAARAQDLVPGAYTPAPAGFNAITISSSINSGDLAFDSSIPIEDGHAAIQGVALIYNRTLNIAGRSASAGVGVPYIHGHLEGTLLGQFQETSRSGLGDVSARFAINLFGAPAMTLKEFAAFRPSTIVGISVSVVLPTGQYDDTKRINLGSNRWGIKPEIGFSRRRDHWTFEGDLGMSFFGDNTDFVNGGLLEQAPIVAMQGHVMYTFRPALWIAADGNYWKGGRLTANTIPAILEQKNSRLGATLALPIGRQQLRIAYSYGAYTTIGGDYKALGVSVSRAWRGRP